MADDVETIMEMLGPREVIGQAIEVIMARSDLTRDAAFEQLVHESSDSHRRVRETAAGIIKGRQGD